MDRSKIIKRIMFHWFVALLVVFFGINIKGLIVYFLNPSDYIITYKFYDYIVFLSTLFKTQVNFFAAITAILSTFISIAIPLSVNQVANSLKDYNDQEVKEMFFNEPVFLQMVSVLVFLLLSLLVWYFIDSVFVVGPLLLSFAILTIFYSYFFFKRVIRYITATHDVVHDYFYKNEIDLFNFE